MNPGNYYNIASNGTTYIAPTASILDKVVIGVPGTATTATIYNGATTSMPVARIDTAPTTGPISLELNVSCPNGITVVTAGTTAANITIIYE